MPPSLIIVAASALFGLAFYDAWKLVGLPAWTSLAIATIPAFILLVSFPVAAYFGRKTGRRVLMQVAPASIAAGALLAYARYVFIGPGDAGGESRLHVIFLPLALGVCAALAIALCNVIARALQRRSAGVPGR